MQSFQCRVENGRAAVAVALVIKMDGASHFIHDLKAEIDGSPQSVSDLLLKNKYRLMSDTQCVRVSLGTKQRGRNGRPPWAHGVQLRMDKHIIADDGLCEVNKDHTVVPNNQVLFTQAQIDEICAACTIQKPTICTTGVLLQSNLSSRQTMETGEQVPAAATTTAPMSDYEMAAEACEGAQPEIELSKAIELCSSSLDLTACIVDYCSTNGDEAMVEMAIEAKKSFLPGCATPGEACSSGDECCDGMICDRSVCKYSELETCSQPKFDDDSCLPHPQGGYFAYATNGSSLNLRCNDTFLIFNDALGHKIHETDDLNQCAELCDATQGCIGFDFNNTKQDSKDPAITIKKHRCSLCQEVLGVCPTLIPTESGQNGATNKVRYYHRTSSGCTDCKIAGDSCSSPADCCNDMICDNGACKNQQLVNCSFAKESADTCVNGHAFATNSSSESKRCKPSYAIPSGYADYFETNDLDECAELCDTTTGCVAFDFKDRPQPSVRDGDSGTYKRCSLCKQTTEGCPKLKDGQYAHYHLTYSGCE